MYNKASPTPKLHVQIILTKVKGGRKGKVEAEKQNKIQHHVPIPLCFSGELLRGKMDSTEVLICQAI